MLKSPIFISGIGRSGTSAVISSLAEHKQVIAPDRVGEAPIVQHFLTFLCEYENTSPQREYNLNNYQMDAAERSRLYSSLISSLQYGKDISLEPDKEKYWVAKVSLSHDTFDKALEVFGGLNIIYVIRNGVEVVNSARYFTGFAELSFEELCRRWSDSVNECRYLTAKDNCAIVRHDELVSDPHKVFASVFAKLGMENDTAPADFIKSTLFNSSFNEASKNLEIGSVFNNRLSCWNQWSDSEKQTFVDICDEHMQELNFERPYESTGLTINKAQPSLAPVALKKEEPAILSPAGPGTKVLRTLAEGSMSVPLLDYHCNVSVKHGYLYMENPKVASTSILKVLQRQENHQFAAKMENPHARDQSPISRISSLVEDQQQHFINSTDIYRFAFVRNPFSRLLSAYLSKIAKPLLPKADILAVLNGTTAKEITDLSQAVDFPTFVDVVCSQEPSAMNPHWNHQTIQLLYDKISYSKVGKFENLESDFAEICSKIFTRKPPVLTHSANETGSTERLSSYFDESLQAKVYKKFYDDFNAFEYEETLALMAKTA